MTRGAGKARCTRAFGLAVACCGLAGPLVSFATAQSNEIPPLHALGPAAAPRDPNQAQAPPDPIKPANRDEFEIMWAISGSSAQPLGTPEKPVAVNGSVRMLYESTFGRPPQGLEYLVGRLEGGQGRWLNTYLEFLDGHFAAIRQYMVERPFVGEQPFYAVIDWEAFDWSFNSENTFNGGTGAQPWRAAVREINRGQLDQEFLRFVQFETQADTWDELVQMGQDEALVAKSYTHFARDFVLRTLQVCRMHSPPGTQWGFYFYPNTTVNPRLDRGIDRTFRDSHDELKWFWPAIDFLAPVLYVVPYRDSTGMYDPSLQQKSAELLRRYYEVNLDEARRVRDTYAPKKPIIPFVMYYYHESHEITVPYEHYFFLTPDNIAAHMLFPRMYGADSIFLWGTVGDYFVNRGTHQPLNVVVDHLNDVWVPAFWAAEDYLRQQTSGGGSSGTGE